LNEKPSRVTFVAGSRETRRTVNLSLSNVLGAGVQCLPSQTPGVAAMTKDLHLIVDQPSPGHHYWTIVYLGVHGEDPSVVDYARGPMPTRDSAMDAGMTALVGHQRAGSPWLGQVSGARFGWNADTVPGTLLQA
jgi:hypothetical protein